MEINPKLCIVPFTGLSISPRGVIRSCCVHTNKNMYEWSNMIG